VITSTNPRGRLGVNSVGEGSGSIAILIASSVTVVALNGGFAVTNS